MQIYHITWCRLTQVVLEKRLLNVCMYVSIAFDLQCKYDNIYEQAVLQKFQIN